MEQDVRVVGVGRSAYHRSTAGWYPVSALGEAIGCAMADASLEPMQVEQVYLCASGGARLPWQESLLRALGHVPPIVSVDASVAGASRALYLARRDIEEGRAHCVLVAGIDHGPADAPSEQSMALWTAAAREYTRRHQCRQETFAMIAVKAHQHAFHNPDADYGQPLGLDDVLAGQGGFAPLPRLQFAAPAYAASALLVCSTEFARRLALSRPVRILAQVCSDELRGPAVAPDTPLQSVGYERDMAVSWEVYERAGIGPADLQLCELHDRATVTELLLYEALGFCREGSAERFIEDGDNTYGGNIVVNPSGGLLGMGFGASTSGLAQCAELVMHLRDRAGSRQVPHASIALQQDAGEAGSIVTLYRRD
ncbi:lipid-transfer protein [Pseudomonas sp. LS44]|uniref:thiolase C-terminal domain-containing protein n=1 Tax=Pseudomonas sp. LS44 TaxID=1357074 RepID=UPI00215ABD2E|nr:lipid-transfer protein [Pseudomonas sp. LS44]UVE19595.1 lipid-transfer protein [Pseudomonas sp. LS44]